MTGSTLKLLATLAFLAPTPPVLAQEVNIEEIFWCHEGDMSQSVADCEATRMTILTVCTSCHTFVPVVKAQKLPDEWSATLAAHRQKAPDMPADDFDRIQVFLSDHFNPDNPPPTLPPALEALGTGQAF